MVDKYLTMDNSWLYLKYLWSTELIILMVSRIVALKLVDNSYNNG